jgi:hypothetical protein
MNGPWIICERIYISLSGVRIDQWWEHNGQKIPVQKWSVADLQNELPEALQAHLKEVPLASNYLIVGGDLENNIDLNSSNNPLALQHVG